MDIHKVYLTTPGIKKDKSQIDILNAFAMLQSKFISSKNNVTFIQKYLQSNPSIKGIYLWGDVGRGKTFLMDLFYNTLNLKKKRRIHFHRMMNEVKNELTKPSPAADCILTS